MPSLCLLMFRRQKLPQEPGVYQYLRQLRKAEGGLRGMNPA
jgi:hypothetical protein